MQAIFSEPVWVYIIIFLAGLIAYVISTLSGGGGSLLLVPVISFFIGGKATAPVVNLGNLVGEPIRIILFWKNIEWKIVRYYLPPAIGGAVLGAWIFSSIKLEWLQIIVGLFLISTIFQYRFGKKERMIATKTVNSFFIGLVQISSYTALGSLKGNLWIYGIIMGIGASAGNWIGKTFLKKVSSNLFRKLVIAVMAISGVIMIIKQVLAQD